MLRPFIRLTLLISALPFPAFAITGGVLGPSDLAAQTILIVSTRGASCTGTVIARDLIITAGHCVEPPANYAVKIDELGSSRIVPVAKIVLHPSYDPKKFEMRKPSPDMAILKISEPLPAIYKLAKISTSTVLPKPGEVFVLAGFGFSVEGDERSMGKLRSVALPAIGITGGIMVRLSSNNARAASACDGDSGGPVFREGALAGVIGWINVSAGRNCGSITGATLTGLQRQWISSTARTFGAAIRD